jgi:hypothetical protein
MKRLIFILLFFVLITSKCDKTQIESSSTYLYEQTYGINQEVESIHDLYALLHSYGQDSIPLEKWPAFMGTNDNGFIIQQMLTKRADSVSYIFIYNIYKKIDTTYYDIKVRKITLTK